MPCIAANDTRGRLSLAEGIITNRNTKRKAEKKMKGDIDERENCEMI
jgi:hypothetical protein